MDNGRERRRQDRKSAYPPEVGVVRIWSQMGPGAEKPDRKAWFVNVHNLGQGGALVESMRPLRQGDDLMLMVRDLHGDAWLQQRGRVVWVRGQEDGGDWQAGLKFAQAKDRVTTPSDEGLLAQGPTPRDLDFVLRTSLINSLPWRAVCPLLNSLRPRSLEDGATLISQGEPAQSLFLVLEGQCLVSRVEDEGARTLGRRGAGQVVGEAALLGGGHSPVQVESLGPCRLWELPATDFAALEREHPAILAFLTELLAQCMENPEQERDYSLGRYLVGRRLGQGAHNLVYKGRHQQLDLPVVIKVIRHALSSDQGFREGLRRTAAVVSGASHPHIAQIYRVEEQYRTMLVVMEYLEGETLRELLVRRGHLPWTLAVNFLDQICQGLLFAHDLGVAHLDVRPANVFICHPGLVKVLDFGLGPVKGSPGEGRPSLYLAPEQLSGQRGDALSDIYRVGLMAFEMVTGRLPHLEDGPAEVKDRRLDQEVPDPSTLRPDLPPGLGRFITTACRRDPAARYHDLSQALADLTPLVPPRQRPRGAAGRRGSLVLLSGNQDQQATINQLLDEFSQSAKEKGINLRIVGRLDL